MNIFSCNLNGIRSAERKGFYEWVKTAHPDILCVQETKAQENQINLEFWKQEGYHCDFFSANKKGYSGVGMMSLYQPIVVKRGIEKEEFDIEGRVLRCDFNDLTVICVYVPSGSMGDHRQVVKMAFLEAFEHYIRTLREQRPNIVVCGDFNICHKAIDINHPELHMNVSGFLPEERLWMDRWEQSGMVDTFRLFNNKSDQYTWWSYRMRSRERNIGWRIDYCWVSSPLLHKVRHADIHPDIVLSDHCPISLWID